ncbi:hypothetical protein AAFO92_04245 [Roseovarius sp. CAU 1744]|uniref:hypothetical protein n=1 Tax=Roseovarius sp. CAU 1744 TaxID=3140368 RepID=UPI00325BF50C
MRKLMFSGALLVAACAPEPRPEADLPFVRGYRAPADQCQLVGESAATVNYLDDAADLVGCPEDYEGVGVFVTETGAQEVARVQGYILFSVPVR